MLPKILPRCAIQVVGFSRKMLHMVVDMNFPSHRATSPSPYCLHGDSAHLDHRPNSVRAGLANRVRPARVSPRKLKIASGNLRIPSQTGHPEQSAIPPARLSRCATIIFGSEVNLRAPTCGLARDHGITNFLRSHPRIGVTFRAAARLNQCGK